MDTSSAVKRVLLACAAIALLVSSFSCAQKPPVAPVRSVVDDFYGTKITDHYRYMEDLKDPEVQRWIKGQADYASSVLESIPGRDALLARLKELDSGAPYQVFSIHRRADGTMFYLKMLASENVGKLYVRVGLEGTERLLVDPEKWNASAEEHHTLQFYAPSPDMKYLVFGLTKSGTEKTTLYVLDLGSGSVSADSIDRIDPWYSGPNWLPDSRALVYTRLPETKPETPPTEVWNNSRTFLHVLGDDPAKDRLLLSPGADPRVKIEPTDFPSIVIPKDSRFALARITHGDQSELTLYSAPVEAIRGPDIPWAKICDVPDSVSDFAMMGEYIYLLSAKGAPRYKLIRTSLAKPDLGAAADVVPPGETVVEGASPAKDALYVGVLDAGYNRIVRVDYRTLQRETLQLPAGSSGRVISASRDIDGVLMTAESWTRDSGILQYDPSAKSFSDPGLQPKGKYDEVPGYESQEVMVRSHDGVLVPLSIVYRSGIALDGSHPTLLTGYGAYGSSSQVYFTPTRLGWLEMGGVYAVAHVRGGGEYGKQWHLAGQKLTKPNTWKDFIACAEYLIEKKFTSPGRLAGQGGSAGGILIGRAITERPDLFAAAVINVGCSDMIRMETTPNGVPNIPEYGSTKTEEGFRGLYAMSALHHVEDGVKYPAVLLTHGINDPRVDPWMSAKMTARLQAASSSGKPVLFRVDYESGHGIGSTREQYHKEAADTRAFLLWQFGVKEFQK